MKLKEAQDLLLHGYSCRYDEKDLDKLFKLFDIEGVNQTHNPYILGNSIYYHLDNTNLWGGSSEPYYRNKTFNLSEVDMEFVLPENWHVVVTEENREVLAKWRGLYSYRILTPYKHIVGMCKHSNGRISKEWNPKTSLVHPDGSYDFGKEITYEQFKTYVLKSEEMKTEKQLLGYKLVKPEYKDAALKISKAQGNWENSLERYDISIKQTTYINSLEKAGVLDLWFEPVYQDIKKDVELVLGDKKMTVVIGKNKIFADGNYWDMYELQSLYSRLTISQSINGYAIKFPKVVIGCSSFDISEIKQIISTYEDFNALF